MSIRIERVTAKNLGPLDSLDLELADLNVIYGRNECGKTYLAEFIIKSLFKNTSFWQIRSFTARGEVRVRGPGGERLAFSPQVKPKLDEQLLRSRPGLPPDLGQLLVVRGAELALCPGNPAGLTRAIAKQYLSGTSVLDAVEGQIPANVKSAQIQAREIEGRNQGEVRAYKELRDGISQIDALFSSIDEAYSGGQRRSLELELKTVQESLGQQQCAKRHLAFCLRDKIQAVEHELDQLPQSNLDTLSQMVQASQIQRSSIENKQRSFTEKAERSRHFLWIKEAIALYQRLQSQGAAKSKTLFLILAGVLAFLALLLAVIAGLAGRPAVSFCALPLFIAAVTLGVLYARAARAQLSLAGESAEMEKLAAEFRNLTGRELTGLPVMEQYRERIEPDYHVAAELASEIEADRVELASLELEICARFFALTGARPNMDTWADELRRLFDQRRSLEEERALKREELARLAVDESDYLPEDPGIAYSKAELDRLQGDSERIADELDNQYKELDSLKQRICDQTRDDISQPWEPLLESLKACRAEKSQECRSAAARIIAGRLVFDVFQTLRQQEDQNIRDGLQSAAVTGPLQKITRYDRIDMVGEEFMLGDRYGEFRLSELSTGAQEQALLALRIGFAAHVLGQEQLFFILDDAFQHSDWVRRAWLVDETIALCENGWQVLYLTMDDHIRQLFGERAAPRLGDRYRCHELPEG